MKQTQALRVMLAGESVFLTGPPGSGKTFVLNKFISLAKRAGKRVAVTASTGIAATHIGGATIHSWSGLGIRDEINERDEKWLKENDRLLKRYNSVEVLIIDEVSMIHGKRLDMINQVAKWLRESEEPFGGMQVILTGDLFQLPPINRGDDKVDFAHLSEAWKQLDPTICYLTEQHRQEDETLLDVLRAMRANDVSEEHFDTLSQRLGRPVPADVVVTKLYSHNQDVESINDAHLEAIQEESKTYVMETYGVQAKVEQLAKSVLAPEVLTLKLGAEVMFVANNFGEGFANGSRGRVVDFSDNLPVVELQRNGRRIAVEKHSWALEEDGKERARVTQLPLRLAWAITIHKSQGMSLDGAEIDLSRAFTPGMGYVALSRVRSLDGLYLKGINNMAMAMHPEVFGFDEQLREASEIRSGTVDDSDFDESTIIDQQPGVASQGPVDETVLEKLKQWRAAEARARSVPLYVVAANKMLEELARMRPESEARLRQVPGVGPKMIERYGADIMGMVATPEDQPGQTKQESSSAQTTDELGEFLSARKINLSDDDINKLRNLLKS